MKSGLVVLPVFLLALGASPALYAQQPVDTPAHLKLAKQAWASSLENAGDGSVAFWHAFDWSQRVFWAERDADEEGALKRRLERLLQLEKCVGDAVKAGCASEHEAAVVETLREHAEDPEGSKVERLRRLRLAVAGMAKAVTPGDASALRRYEGASGYLRWEETPPLLEGRAFTFEEDEEDESSPQDERHRERMLWVLRPWLRTETLSAEQRAFGVQEICERSNRSQPGLVTLIVDSTLQALERAPSLELVERIFHLTTVPNERSKSGVLSFDDRYLPEWDDRQLQALEQSLGRQVTSGRLPSSGAALIAFRRLTFNARQRARPRVRVGDPLLPPGRALALAERLLEEPDAEESQDWVRALRDLGPFAQEATAVLIRVLGDLQPTDSILEDVAETLGRIVSPAAAQALAAEANRKAGSLIKRTLCLKALVWSGPLAETGARTALGGELRLPALELLGEVGFRDETARAIASVLDDPKATSDERVAALVALRRNPIPAQVTLAAVKRYAIGPLGHDDPPAARSTLAILERCAAGR